MIRSRNHYHPNQRATTAIANGVGTTTATISSTPLSSSSSSSMNVQNHHHRLSSQCSCSSMNPSNKKNIATTTKTCNIEILFKTCRNCCIGFFFLLGLLVAPFILLETFSLYQQENQQHGELIQQQSHRLTSTFHYGNIRKSQQQQQQQYVSQNHDPNHIGRNRRIPDGTFNGLPIYKQQVRVSQFTGSHVHCVGESYQNEINPKDKVNSQSWKDRSCHFHFLCYNTSSYEYIVFENEQLRNLSQHIVSRPTTHISSSFHRHRNSNTVSIGGINLKWGHTGIPRLEWFPRIKQLPPMQQNYEYDTREFTYYELPPNTVLIPFHSMNGANPGHLVWDDFLPMYTLLSMFQLLDYSKKNNDFDLDTTYQQHDQYRILPIRHVLQDGQRGLWASCDFRDDKRINCDHMIKKFWPLMGGIYNTTSPFEYNLTTNIQPIFHEMIPHTSDIVCSQHGVAGMGSLTDHGLYKAHGWEEPDYDTIHNHGRGEQLYNFRNYMLQNMNMNPYETVQANGPFHIVFSQKSSDIFIRSMDFVRQIEIVKEYYSQQSNVIVENYVMKNLSLPEQLEVTKRASIYITLCGGGAVSAMFLPKGSSVILYYAEDGGTRNGKMNYKPALLDFDIFNAMSYLRVHWLPRNTRKTDLDEQTLLLLIQQELDIIQSQIFT